MDQEVAASQPGERLAGRLAALAGADPAGFQQRVDRALADRHAADVFDLGARDGLVIRDDGESFDTCTRQLARQRDLRAQILRQVGCGAQHPTVVDTHQIDAARSVLLLQLDQERLQVGVLGHARLDGGIVEGFGGREKNGFEDTEMFGLLCHSCSCACVLRR